MQLANGLATLKYAHARTLLDASRLPLGLSRASYSNILAHLARGQSTHIDGRVIRSRQMHLLQARGEMMGEGEGAE